MTEPLHRPFIVRPLHLAGHHGRALMETSFEAAAVAFVEDHPFVSGDADELGLLVREVESGVERCYRIDLVTGETQPCG